MSSAVDQELGLPKVLGPEAVTAMQNTRLRWEILSGSLIAESVMAP